MDRLTKLAANLYPRWWRDRYGDEFTALLEDARPGLGGTLDVLKGALAMQLSSPSSIKTLLLCTIAGLIVGIGATFFLTPQYSSNALVTVTRGERADLIDAIKRYSNEVMGRQELDNIISKWNLYPNERSNMPYDAVLELMKRNIRIAETTAIDYGRERPAVELSFRYHDPVLAQRVAHRLVVAYMANNFAPEDRVDHTKLRPGPLLSLLAPASMPKAPISPVRKNFAAALILRFRRKRQTT